MAAAADWTGVTNDGERADIGDRRRALGAPPFAVLAGGAASCRVVDLLEDWDRWARAEAVREADRLRER